jgi:hypothetical protein
VSIKSGTLQGDQLVGDPRTLGVINEDGGSMRPTMLRALAKELVIKLG